ncbi:23S rRNA (adenine(2503)-C(2))-methyltransferase RlmN [Fervidobacterium thailandense]|uniref:Probable dual-specificity RNA methyltransferase RlmN n=1 Tax=Fervidobacterium thailandense TaxID=1008305 RepID=A0A1E3G4T6_9BACT|nr:23S rRNA (adenine(2503)-C(2))-methyltransferase RlmN [Fervidobacterium thailandense]ODN31192.1 23S rRNA (adenine(2503)-C(2))-methyltransferase RlmN [Fervidobacterium thailandense]
MKRNLLNYQYEELVEQFGILGLERYRVDQVYDWVFKKKVFDFSAMTNLSKEHRRLLSENFDVLIPKLLDMQVSAIDKTTKFLWELSDGKTIESVLLFHPDRVTACISTQVGCPVKCVFCATGQSGYDRNLSAGEIVAQVLAMELHRKVNIGNIVFMGMGEPLLNYEEVVKSVRILHNPKGKGISMRRITISTVGIPEKIVQLAHDLPEVKLAISLHAPTNYKRDQLVPLNKKYSVEEIIHAVKEYQRITKNRVTFEYVLIREFNDFADDAEKLAELLRGIGAYVNLIPINPVQSTGSIILERPQHWALERFKEILEKHNVECEIRREKGTDIDAACGQLRRRHLLNAGKVERKV